MRTLVTGLALGLVVPLAATTPAAVAGAPTCSGQPATVVGVDHGTATGTDGPDVIVTGGATETDAGAGDDLVCVTGANEDARIDLGAGDDRLLVETSTGARVDTGDREAVGHDEVQGGLGHEHVVTGVPDQPNDDDIRLAGGSDDLVLDGLPTGTFEAGDGERYEYVSLRTSEPHAWSVDRVADEVLVDGAPVRLSGFDTYLVDRLPWTAFEFRGTADPETVSASEGLRGPDQGPVDLRMGGGHDLVYLDSDNTGSIDTGPGDDFLWLSRGRPHRPPSGHVELDLGHDRYRVGGHPTVRVAALEGAEVSWFESATLLGDADRNSLRARGCRAVIRGGAGADALSMWRPKPCSGTRSHFLRAYGGPGDDTLDGSSGNDRLRGGAGRDTANGSGGHDWCRAEVRFSCELP